MRRIWKKGSLAGMAFLLALSLFGGASAPRAHASDEFDAMRDKRRTMLTGGASLDTGDADIASAVGALANTASQYWSSMNVSPGRTYLWSDQAGMGNSIHIRIVYERLKTMALAYATAGSPLYGDAALETDIVDALDYMYDTRYHENVTTTPSGTSNWWDWQIGIPMQLNDTVILMYDSLSSAQVDSYMRAVHRFTPTVNLTGANRAWKAIVVAASGIIGKDGSKLADARSGMDSIFQYVVSGDGFYRDGSFIQHSTIPYTGGYGLDLLLAVSDLMALLHGSDWQVTNPDHANVWAWVYDAYQPLIYKGAMMDMVRGREISRDYRQDHIAGHVAIQGIVQLAEIAPTAQANDFKRMVKGWLQADVFRNFYESAPVGLMPLAKAIMSDAAVTPADELVTYRQYASMDRAVQLRPGYGFGLAMYSNRTSSFEAINSENGKGWYTSAGVTSLYNGDLGHYSEDYWPTVDAYRLPGTTVLSQTASASHRSANNWAGGTEMDGIYGVSGMDLAYADSTLAARKSWFMLDDEIVALGAGIASADGIPVETIVENRRLNADGSNALTVNGTAQPGALGWNGALSGVQWAHLAGSAAGADIGYYFPNPVSVNMLREARTGNWKQINNRPVTPSTPHTRNYMTMWLDHGVNPAGSGYQYVLLPNRTSAEVASYAANPDVQVLANTSAVQAVKETSLGIVGANFWNDGTETIDLITVNRKASVMTKETAGAEPRLEVSISDPTQANTGTILLELDRSASGYVADPGVTVTQLSPTIKLSVQVSGARGKTFKASFELGEPPAPIEIIVDNADPTGVTKTGSWKTASTQPDRYGINYLHDDNADKGGKSVTFTPQVPVSGLYEVYMMWPEHFNRATDIPVEIVHAGGTALASVDQTGNGGVWNLLGTYSFQAGTTGSVTIRNDGTTGYVVADAIRLVPAVNPVPEPIIVDNADSTGVTHTGGWKTASTQTDRYGSNYLHDDNTGKGSKSAVFTPDLPAAGTYRVYMMWPAHFNRDTAIPVEIAHAGGADHITVNQTANGGVWNLLGTYSFGAGSTGSVTIRNDGTTGFVVADAVMFEYVP